MFKSAISGGVVLVAIVVLLGAFTSLYELSPVGLTTWAVIGLVSAIVFASFGGFKPLLFPNESDDEPDPDLGGSPARGSIVMRIDPIDTAAVEEAITVTDTGSVAPARTAEPHRTAADAARAGSHPGGTLFGSRAAAEGERQVLVPSGAVTTTDSRRALFGSSLATQLDDRAPEAPTGAPQRVDAGIDTTDGPSLFAGSPRRRRNEQGSPTTEPPARPSHVPRSDPAREAAAGADALADIGFPPPVPDTTRPSGYRVTVLDSPKEEPVSAPASKSLEPASVAEQGTELPVVANTPGVDLSKYTPAEVLAVVKAQESELVDTLIDEGLLTTEGPITDRDVRTMVFVAVSSSELVEVLSPLPEDDDSPSAIGG